MNIPATVSNVFIIIGCFLPWIQMGALINNRGINNPDAMIILGASVVGLILSIATKKKWALINLVVGLICGIVGIIDYRDVAERVESFSSGENILSLSVSLGSGLYLILIGSALLILTSIYDVISDDKKEISEPESVDRNEDGVVFQKEGVLNMTVADELKKYKDLLDTGAITEAEYESIKAKLLK